MRVSAGSISEIPADRCVPVADGAAVMAQVDGAVVAFENRCLHQESPLAGGIIHNGVLICPLHFWRYRLPSGEHAGGEGTLPGYPVEVIDGEVFVDLPDPAPRLSMREMMLQHAREWVRDR
jgi:nitrite reductase/ring-hydroxylating ferredoxin subunit